MRRHFNKFRLATLNGLPPRSWFYRTRRLATVLAIGAVVGTPSSGCTQAQLAGQASSYLIIDSLEGASGATPDKFSAVVGSDVVTLVKTTVAGVEVLVPTVYEDPGKVAFRLAMKDPGAVDAPTSASSLNFITVNRYHVRFTRTDGRNTPGVDVPYPFDGAMTVTVNAGGAIAGLLLVRVQAKEEAPLRALANAGAAATISTIAEITFYGADQAGRTVSVTGQISVDFSDWGDPQ